MMANDNHLMEMHGDLINKWCDTLEIGDNPDEIVSTIALAYDMLINRSGDDSTEYELSARMVDLGVAPLVDRERSEIFNKKSVHGSFPQFVVDTRERSKYTREGVLAAEGSPSLGSLLQCRSTDTTLDGFRDDYIDLLVENHCIILDGAPTDIYRMGARSILLIGNAQRAEKYFNERGRYGFTETEIVYMAVRDEIAAYYPAYYDNSEYNNIRKRLDAIRYKCGIWDIISDKRTDLDGGMLPTPPRSELLRRCLDELIAISNDFHDFIAETVESVEFNTSTIFKVPNITMTDLEVMRVGSCMFYLPNSDRMVAPALVFEKKAAIKEEPTAFDFIKGVCRYRRDFYDFLAHTKPAPMVAKLG